MTDWNPGQPPKIPRLYYVLRTLIIRAENYYWASNKSYSNQWHITKCLTVLRAFHKHEGFFLFLYLNSFMQNNSAGTFETAWSCLKIHLSASCQWCLRHWIPPALSANFNKGLFFFWVYCFASALNAIPHPKIWKHVKMPLFRHICKAPFAVLNSKKSLGLSEFLAVAEAFFCEKEQLSFERLNVMAEGSVRCVWFLCSTALSSWLIVRNQKAKLHNCNRNFFLSWLCSFSIACILSAWGVVFGFCFVSGFFFFKFSKCA